MASIPLPLPRARAHAGQIDWPVLAGLALLIVLIRGTSFGNPVSEMDDQLYSFVGWRMLHGELPFTDWFDRKPFGLFALFAAAHAVGGPSEMAYQVLAMLFTLGGAALTFHLTRPLADRAGCTIAAAFYVVIMSAYGGNSGQSEAFFVPLMLLAMALVRDPARADAPRRAVLAMLLCGAVLQIKYTVLPQCLFLGLWVLWGQFRGGANMALLARNAAVYAALGVLPTALVGLFYLSLGEFEAFWYANFISFFERNPVYASRFNASQIMWGVLLALPLLGALYYGLRVEAPRDRRLYGFYAMWSVSVAATVLLPKTIYMFYLASLAPCLALLAIPFYARGTLLRAGPAAGLLVFYISILNLPDRYVREAGEARDFAPFVAEVAGRVNAADRCLYIYDGPMALYRLSGGCTMTTRIYPDHLNNALETGAVGVDQVAELERIFAARPAVIVTASRAVTPQNPASLALVTLVTNRDYTPVAHTRIATRIITAWALKNPAPQKPPASGQGATATIPPR